MFIGKMVDALICIGHFRFIFFFKVSHDFFALSKSTRIPQHSRLSYHHILVPLSQFYFPNGSFSLAERANDSANWMSVFDTMELVHEKEADACGMN
jgi:hypothetical protein